MNKLDILAQKEEELRRLNEKLEERERNVTSPLRESRQEMPAEVVEQSPERSLEESAEDTGAASPPVQASPERVAEPAPTADPDDEEYDAALSQVEQYRAVLDKCKELEKTVNF